jgi:hypothetical protein
MAEEEEEGYKVTAYEMAPEEEAQVTTAYAMDLEWRFVDAAYVHQLEKGLAYLEFVQVGPGGDQTNMQGIARVVMPSELAASLAEMLAALWKQ